MGFRAREDRTESAAWRNDAEKSWQQSTHLGIDIRVKGAVLFEFFDLKRKMMGVRMKHHRPVHGDEAHRHFSAGISQPRQRWKRTVGLSSSSV